MISNTLAQTHKFRVDVICRGRTNIVSSVVLVRVRHGFVSLAQL